MVTWMSSSLVTVRYSGIVNQGDMVGNTKGKVDIVIQKGEVLPRGTPKCWDGVVAQATASLLSGIAFSGSCGSARTKTRKVIFLKSDKTKKQITLCYLCL